MEISYFLLSLKELHLHLNENEISHFSGAKTQRKTNNNELCHIHLVEHSKPLDKYCFKWI